MEIKRVLSIDLSYVKGGCRGVITLLSDKGVELITTLPEDYSFNDIVTAIRSFFPVYDSDFICYDPTGLGAGLTDEFNKYPELKNHIIRINALYDRNNMSLYLKDAKESLLNNCVHSFVQLIEFKKLILEIGNLEIKVKSNGIVCPLSQKKSN